MARRNKNDDPLDGRILSSTDRNVSDDSDPTEEKAEHRGEKSENSDKNDYDEYDSTWI